MNYTKGNWTIDYNGTIGHIKAVNDNTERTPTVARYDIFSKFGGKIGEMRKEEEFANAKLIAAAPEMYEALKALMKCYEEKGQLLSFNVDIARQAINKAES
jgi:hypothetical protein